jgi:POTRA domain, FtsQ-type
VVSWLRRLRFRSEKAAGYDPRWLREARVQLPDPEPGPKPRRNREATISERPPFSLRNRRSLAVLLALLEVVGLVVLGLSPTFRVRHVVVAGAVRVPDQQVVKAAGLDRPVSIFVVNSAEIRRRLEATSWIESATVTAQLPDQVTIAVHEWSPVAIYRPLQGPAVYLNTRGISLGPAASDQGSLVRIEGPAQSTNAGQGLLDERLLIALVNIQRELQGTGAAVQAFRFDRCWDLTMVAQGGWRALFGRMLTGEDYATLGPKLGALRSVSSQADLSDASTYINLMSPWQPAVGRGDDRPPTPTPTPSPSPSPTPSPSPGTSSSAPSAAAPRLLPSPTAASTPTRSPVTPGLSSTPLECD